MTSAKRSVTIVGGGQSGLQLALGLLKDGGYDVRVVQNRTGDEIAKGRVTSSQCMFDASLQNERDLGINFWEDQCPTVDSINFAVPAPDGSGGKAMSCRVRSTCSPPRPFAARWRASFWPTMPPPPRMRALMPPTRCA